jgi:hypothetical protein
LRGYPPCIFREVIAMKTCQISGVEMDRLKILSDVLNGKLTLKEASHALHLSYRQAIRLKKKVKEQGIEGLLKKAPPKRELSIILCL